MANLYNKRKSEKHNRLPLRQIAQKDTDLPIQTPANGLEFVYANYSGKIIDAVEQGKIVKKGDVIGFFEKK